MMKIVHLQGREEEKEPETRKPKPRITKKQERNERVARWILKQKLRDFNSFCKENADQIAEIRKQDPSCELPAPTLLEVKEQHNL